MITINLDPVLFGVGHFALRWYSLIVVTAVAVGAWVAWQEAKRRGLEESDFTDALWWVIVAGMIGARLFHVIDHWPDEYAAAPWRALYVWEGGLAIWGAVLGGLVALAVFARRRGLRLALLADIGAPGLVLGQAVGRVACVITGDAMGKATAGPIGFAYTQPTAMVPQLGVYYTPMPVYELIGNLAIFALLWRLRKRDWPEGLLILVYLGLYSLERFFLAFVSSYKRVAFGLTQSQVIALVALAVTLPLILRLQRVTAASVVSSHSSRPS